MTALLYSDSEGGSQNTNVSIMLLLHSEEYY